MFFPHIVVASPQNIWRRQLRDNFHFVLTGRIKPALKCHILLLPSGTICSVYRCKVMAHNCIFHISRKCTCKLPSTLRPCVSTRRFYAAKSAEDEFVHCALVTAASLHYFNWVFNRYNNSHVDLKAHWLGWDCPDLTRKWYNYYRIIPCFDGFNFTNNFVYKKKIIEKNSELISHDAVAFHHCLILPKVTHFERRHTLKSFAVFLTKLRTYLAEVKLTWDLVTKDLTALRRQANTFFHKRFTSFHR